ncbi:ABC transporter substrate-binding protein [Streptomyces diacarni]|uniref:ABC transporter substrate-binding protein n=1 Tax=Streptomyces diacarni TaxID=2800381 RepID=A0A367ETV7_9ACTN|nr:ABC transporter substrate-binding protein [Streptomyces diacarni]RCG20600.1 ABC transporter substrate-binding protein [Streptomyces diacarni]
MPDRKPAAVERRTFLRMSGALGAATAFTASLSACGGPDSTVFAGREAGRDTIEAGISYTLSTGFDPMITSGATPFAANMHLFEGLVDLDPATLEARPGLATALPNKLDERTYRATLRDGATWHDGSAVTTEDVVFSFERVMDPDNASVMAQFIPFLDKVEAVDARTVEFTLKHPFALFPSRISVVRIVPKKIVEKDSKRFDAHPVGSGPYRFVKAVREDRITFARWEKYNGEHPARAKRMVWRLISDPSARVSALESGRVQAIEDVPYLDIPRMKGFSTVQSVPSFGLLFLMFNCSRKPFDDKRVRQALHYAVDTEKLIRIALLGGADAAVGYLQRDHPDHRRAEAVYDYDPARARKLLDEAGVRGLSVKLLVTDTAWVNDAAPLIKEGWDAVGVRTSLDIAQSPAQYAKVDQGGYQALLAPGDPSVFGNDVDLLMRWFYNGLWPTTRYKWAKDPAYRKLTSHLDDAARAESAKERDRLWARAQDLVAEHVPLYPLLHRRLPSAWDEEKLTRFAPLPTTGLSFLDTARA